MGKLMSSQDIDKAYVSPIDKFLYRLDAETPKSPSQIAEIVKHQRVSELRDNAQINASADTIWEEF
jgi:hypothetical protein